MCVDFRGGRPLAFVRWICRRYAWGDRIRSRAAVRRCTRRGSRRSLRGRSSHFAAGRSQRSRRRRRDPSSASATSSRPSWSPTAIRITLWATSPTAKQTPTVEADTDVGEDQATSPSAPRGPRLRSGHRTRVPGWSAHRAPARSAIIRGAAPAATRRCVHPGRRWSPSRRGPRRGPYIIDHRSRSRRRRAAPGCE